MAPDTLNGLGCMIVHFQEKKPYVFLLVQEREKRDNRLRRFLKAHLGKYVFEPGRYEFFQEGREGEVYGRIFPPSQQSKKAALTLATKILANSQLPEKHAKEYGPKRRELLNQFKKALKTGRGELRIGYV